jgi:tRNA nucleotidyltransferase (CCA-adding enzyme)
MSKLYNLCYEIKKNNGNAYIVGGFVRDILLGIESKDIDIEVFGLEASTLEKILSLMGTWRKVGSYEIYLMKSGYEVSLPRDMYNRININLGVEDAARRRDMTINSIYYDIVADKYLDYFGGLEDIKIKRLHYVDREGFVLDPLRILRVVGFLSRFPSFTISTELQELIEEQSHKLKEIKKERIYIELEKILLRGLDIKRAFEVMDRLGIRNHVFEEFEGKDLDFDALLYNKRDMRTSLALLLLKTTDYELFLRKNLYDKRLIGEVENILKNYKNFESLVRKPEKIGIKKLAVEANIEGLMKVYMAEKRLKYMPKDFIKLYEEAKKTMKPLVDGRDLIKVGFKQGLELGKILKSVYFYQLENEELTKKDLIEYAKKM